MTVKQLIEVLKCQPEDYKVYIMTTHNGGHAVAGGEVQFVERNELHHLNTITLWNEDN